MLIPFCSFKKSLCLWLQTNNVNLKIFTEVYLLQHVNRDVLLLLYYSFVHSKIYCLNSWGIAAKSYLNKVLLFEERILHISYKKPFDFPAAKLFQENTILTADKLFTVKVLTSAHSLFYSNKRSLVTHDHFARKSLSNLPIPLYTSSAGQNSRSYQQNNLWNQLPEYWKPD